MFEWLQRGGPVMWPIVFCSILAFAIILERLYQFYRSRIDTETFMKRIAETVRRNKIVEAVQLCEQTPGPIASIVKAGLIKHDRPRGEIREAIQESGLLEVPRLEKNVAILATIAHIAPLLGLLGTVTGMVRCFQLIQVKATSMNPVSASDLAGGIWEALITTVAGLVVAIPTYVAYNYLVSRVNQIVLDMEKSAVDVTNLLTERADV